MLNIYFWNKNKKMYQIDLNSDLKEDTNEGKYVSICLTYTWI